MQILLLNVFLFVKTIFEMYLTQNCVMCPSATKRRLVEYRLKSPKVLAVLALVVPSFGVILIILKIFPPPVNPHSPKTATYKGRQLRVLSVFNWNTAAMMATNVNNAYVALSSE